MYLSKSILAGAFSLLVAHGTHAAITEQSWSYTYTTAGKMETADGPRTDVTDVTTYTYDGNNRLATTTNALGHLESILEYDTAGRPLKAQNANGVQTHFTYTARGWLKTTTVKAASGDLVTTYTYDPVGQVTNIAYPDGSSVTFEYDAARRLTATENSLGERVEYTLDAAGNIKEEKVFAADGTTLVRSVSRSYDELSRLIDVDGNNGQNTSIAYDKNGKRISTTDGNQNSTGEARDALGRVETVTDADSNQIKYTYDSADRITSVTDQRGNKTTYQYDFAGNLLKLTSPDTGITTYDYDEAGNLKVRTDARGITANYSYDALNRLTAISYPGNTSENAIFIYDSTEGGNKGIGQLTGYSNDAGSTALTYDDLGRITRQDDTIASWSFSTQYSYDSLGRISSITYPSGRIVSYSRDALGRISAVTSKENSQASARPLVSNIQYQPFGGISSMDYGNGITQRYSYDLDGRLETVSASGIGTIRSEFYTYDLANNITGIADNLDNTKDRGFIYDKLNRLTDEGFVEGENRYYYDLVGNRTQKDEKDTENTQNSTVYNYEANSNRLTSKAGKVWVTDEVGNTISSEDGSKLYTYNHANRLKTYSEDGTLKGTYYYNALGQRVRTDKAEDNLLHYDLSGQYLGETNMTTDGSPIQSQVDYIYVDNMPIAQVRTTYSDGQVQSTALTYLHTDHLNTPRIATNESQAIVWRWDSDAFGKSEPNADADGDTNQTLVNLRFPGQIKGTEAPHYYNYFRDYDAGSGRYLQSDPIGLDDGPNTFVYVGGDPVNSFDSNGLNRRRVNAPSNNQTLINLQVNTLVNTIRRNYDPGFSYRTVRPLNHRYNRDDVTALQNALNQYQRYGQCPASGYSPTGQSGSPLNVLPGPSNLPTAINGTFFSSHAMQRMQGRGIPPSAVLNTINNGQASPGNRPGTTYHSGSRVNAVTNSSTGNVVTVIPSGGS
ncbi:RHS repeat-associated core domain-containing protein [Microbulbifer sp. VAAC004]|uniref:RHS repeat-associated core domain-containing protein n=1 Tax=unclassified Microbulbifer TaxID=2619833 RepID=UPI0040399F68